jgi:GTP-binding protein
MSINFRKTVFLSVAANLEMCPQNKLPEVVLAGRSNVGKSSFINAIGDNRTLAKVSSMPGKTKLVIYFLADNKLLFADLPGYGYAKAAKEDKAKYQSLVDDYLTSGERICPGHSFCGYPS